MTKSFPSHRQPRSWLKICIEVDSKWTDPVAAFLTELTKAGVQLAPTPAGNRECIIGYQENSAETATVDIELQNFLSKFEKLAPGATVKMETEMIQEEDWGESWKEHFKPIKITPGLVIKPSWEEYPPSATEKVIEMDPGMAFGTGHHASTKLAAQLLETVFSDCRPPERILDVGTGTGILAMASALFGGRSVLALDNDPDAVAAAQDNVTRNKLNSRIEVSARALGEVSGPFDLIVANITSDVLIIMAPALTAILATEGLIILAGILKGEQEEAVRRKYAELGFTVRENPWQDEWAALLLSRTMPNSPAR